MDKQESQSFGRCIWQARRKKGLNQRELAVKVGVDYTYLSKLENDHVEPSEKVIRSLAEHLSLNAEQLMYLAGRMTQNDSEAFEQLLKVNYKEMPALFRRMRESPGIDSLVKARDEQIVRLQKENAELRTKVEKLQKKLTLFKPYIFYSKEEIERKANEILHNMPNLHNDDAAKIPIDATRVCDYLNLSIDIEEILPDEHGLIVAKILPLERRILVNSGLPEMLGTFTEFTIAHEIGHWVLHINQEDADILSEEINENSDDENQVILFLCRSASSPIDKFEAFEWQAQYFASCLLMPRYVLQELRKERDLTNWKHLFIMAKELGVTISSLIYRLQNLGWIYIPKGSKQIYPGKIGLETEQPRMYYL
ncbi:MAG: helix-turn-helix domain-containing protein [Nostoc sp. DedQUE08]|uniref:helix-turn-helix domain-containing protein n=1 Tax=Nostoc sp. DedQUE08 TaxID=3075393 RepID=UPI002AD38CCF|nr:helix-turn-helix domain-containing protein [Nostoc sp. DedQUE08]MDZ8070311.1 helix-turn-helix domain-containing protein [Nostoc sp. DedQUE08]